MKIGYGLIGLGGIARTHLQGLKCLPVIGTPVPAVDLSALLTTDRAKKEQAAQIGFARVVHNLDEFLAVPGLDVVDICTPNNLHYEQILAAAKRGKHIYYEKPLCLNGAEAAALQTELADCKSIIQGAYVLRFSPAVAKARALLKKDALGKIHSFRFTSYHSSYLNPDRPGAWRLKHATSGGGALMDLGSHLLDLLRFLLGEAVEVTSWFDTVVKTRRWPQGEAEVDVDDHALVALTLENGARGTVEVSRVAVGGDGMGLEIYGEKGALHIDPARNACRWFGTRGQQLPADDGSVEDDAFLAGLKEVYPPARLSLGWMVDVHLASLAWFLRSVSLGEAPGGSPNLEEGIRTQKLLETAYTSIKE